MGLCKQIEAEEEVVAYLSQIRGFVREHNETKKLLDKINSWGHSDGRFLTFPRKEFDEIYKKYYK